jgi:hypothetical protein
LVDLFESYVSVSVANYETYRRRICNPLTKGKTGIKAKTLPARNGLYSLFTFFLGQLIKTNFHECHKVSHFAQTVLAV